MANLSERKSLTAAAKLGDEQAIASLKAQRKAQREASLRAEELRMRLLQLSEKHWDQTICILKGWMDKE